MYIYIKEMIGDGQAVGGESAPVMAPTRQFTKSCFRQLLVCPGGLVKALQPGKQPFL
jgi:hypothetical protein